MNEHSLAHALEWIEEKSKPLFVAAALLLYLAAIVRIAGDINPFEHLNDFLIEALAALSIPFGVILLQELLELVAYLSDSNLVSARRQFEIVLLVIIRSFFKSFAKVNNYVGDGQLGDPVKEAIVKVIVIVLLVGMMHFFRRWSESKYLSWYAGQGKRKNLVKQLLVVILILFVLVYQLFFERIFEEGEFIQLVFTGMIIIEALFLIWSILDGNFGMLVLESSLVIALIFARFPLFASNLISYSLSALGVAFATAELFLFYRISRWMLDNNVIADEGYESAD